MQKMLLIFCTIFVLISYSFSEEPPENPKPPPLGETPRPPRTPRPQQPWSRLHY